MLDGVTVLVAGAGLAGLAAAHDLVAMGASVTVVDARDRVGGRVWTIRNGFIDGQHGEAGGDLIDESHHELRRLAERSGLTLSRVLRRGWGRPGRMPRAAFALAGAGACAAGNALAEAVSELADRYRLAEQRWDSPISRRPRASIRRPVARRHSRRRRAARDGGRAAGILPRRSRGAVAARARRPVRVERMVPPPEKTYRIDGGNDRLATVLAEPLGDRLRLGTELVAVSHRGRQVRASLKHRRQLTQVTTDFLVLHAAGDPGAPPSDDAGAAAAAAPGDRRRCATGSATKTLLQFSKRFWRLPGRPPHTASPLPFGAVWDANEEQRGTPGILTLLAGGAASDATNELVGREGVAALARSLDWLGSGNGRARGRASRLVGRRSVRARRLRVLRSGVPARAALVAGAALRPALLRGRAHQPRVAGLHERRGRERPPRRRRDRGHSPARE